MRPVNERPLRDAFGVWLASLAATGAFGLLGLVVPFIQENLLGLVAAVFLYVPIWVLDRRRIPLGAYGFRLDPLPRSLAHAILAIAVVFPPYLLGHRLYQTEIVGRTAVFDVGRLARFDRDLEGRPDFERPGVYVWTEEFFRAAAPSAQARERLLVYWTGSGPAPSLQVSLLDGAAQQPTTGLSLARRPDGEFAFGKVVAPEAPGGPILFSPGGAGGVALDLTAGLTLRIRGETPVLTGRWSLERSLPLESQQSPWWWLALLATQILLVALPEEWFYRGFLQARMEEGFTKRYRVLGAELGAGWLLSSACFALGHLVLDARPERLAVFFPSLLFGWLRARTGNIVASVLFHAACNVYAQVLGYLYVG